MTAQVRPQILSRFERLPAELRSQIYEYLGFPPPSKRTWVSVCHSVEVEISEIIFFDPFCKFAKSYPRFLSPYEEIPGDVGIFSRLGEDDISLLGVGYRNCYAGCQQCSCNTKWIPFEASMMSVNTRINSELCEIIYSRLMVEFCFELSDRPVHFTQDWWKHNDKLYWCGYTHIGYVDQTHTFILPIKTILIAHATELNSNK